MRHTLTVEEHLTYCGHRQSHSHGNAHEEGRQEDLGEEALRVPLGAVEPLDDETVELTELQPPALQLEAALALQHLCFWGGRALCVVCRRREEGGRRQSELLSLEEEIDISINIHLCIYAFVQVQQSDL